MSEGIRINVPATPNFVGFDSTRREQVIDVLPRTLEIRHRVGNGHQRG